MTSTYTSMMHAAEKYAESKMIMHEVMMDMLKNKIIDIESEMRESIGLYEYKIRDQQ